MDIDEHALEIAKRNVANLDLESMIDIIRINVNEIPQSFCKKFDIVITNPPFGIRSQKSADINFLRVALDVWLSNLDWK